MSLPPNPFSNTELVNILSLSGEATAIYAGKDLIIEMASDAMLSLWGTDRSVIGKPLEFAAPQYKGHTSMETLRRVFDSSIAHKETDTPIHLHVDGAVGGYYYDITYTPMQDEQGQTMCIVHVAKDVTPRTRVTAELARQLEMENLLRNVVDGAPFPIAVYKGAEMVIVLANQMIKDVWGKGNDVVGKTYTEILPELVDSGIFEQVAGVYNTGIPFHARNQEVRLLVNNAIKYSYFNYSFTPVYDLSGKIYGVMNTGADVTDLELIRQKFEKNASELSLMKTSLELELEAGNLIQRQKDDFIAIASHELKTPLTSLTAIIQLLNRKFASNDDPLVTTAMAKANAQVKKMNLLINGFLNVSRLESGKAPIKKQRFPFEVLLHEVVEEVSMTTAAHDVSIIGCPEVFINADRDQISAVLSNLLNNAVKYSPGGKKIQVECHVHPNEIQVSVSDQGIGIADDDLTKLFDRYFRVESAQTTHISGFGIGLYLSAEIIREHGGRIWAESSGDGGSTFYFTLPVA